MSDWIAAIDPMRPGRFISPNDGPVSFINNIINMMTQQGGPPPHGTVHLHIGTSVPFPGGPLPRELEAAIRISRDRTATQHPARTSRDDPTQSVAFIPTLTTSRWQEEARLLFGQNPHEQSQRVINSILELLVPPAMEAAKRREIEEAARQKKLNEEREAAAKAKEAARHAEEGEDALPGPSTEGEQMDGVEQSQPSDAPEVPEASASEPVPRVTTMIRNREVDITELGIDLEYLEALPEEFREEVLMQQIHQQRATAAASGQEPSEISPEFLEALPAEIRDELLQQEASERRRREREEARRRAAANGSATTTPAMSYLAPAAAQKLQNGFSHQDVQSPTLVAQYQAQQPSHMQRQHQMQQMRRHQNRARQREREERMAGEAESMRYLQGRAAEQQQQQQHMAIQLGNNAEQKTMSSRDVDSPPREVSTTRLYLGNLPRTGTS